MHDPNYVKCLMQHMKNAINRLGYLRWHMNATLDNMLSNTYSSKSIEIQCGLNDAPSPVHARQMNDACMQSIRYANRDMP